jgi:predicted enzyme related to lactoylglutathione lyase
MSSTATAVSITGIDVTTYLVKDPKRATTFWRDVMGLPCTWSSEQGAEFELPDGATFGLWRLDDGNWYPGNGVMFRVADINAAANHFRGRGAKIGDHIEANEACYMAFGEDTEGNTFILHQPKG